MPAGVRLGRLDRGHSVRRRAFVRSDAPSHRTPPDGPAVLVVDDDASIRSMLVDILSYEGYRVIAARDGMEALAVLDRETPFVVLLDVRMPMLDGHSFAQAVRDGRGRVPIVVMTASDASTRSREIQADAYVAKPFELPELLITVARFRDLAGSAPRHLPGVS